ncbi:MAG: hypothetical protein K6E21_05670 [Bacilli bacterium]|nr:hypothetical protein [Bacilli bacterium]
MLAELLLCGVASMDVGLKTAINENKFIMKEPSINEMIMNDGVSQKKLMNVQSSIEIDGWYSNNENYWVKRNGFNENDNYQNSNPFGAQLVSPSFEIQTNFQNCYGYIAEISGTFFEYDVDYYCFEVYGDANFNLSFDGPTGKELKIYQFKSKTGKYEYFDEHYDDCSNIQTKLDAGTYCICLLGNRSYNNDGYSINLKVSYITNDENISIGNVESSYGINAVNWVSDYNPLDKEGFSKTGGSVSISQDKLNNTIEGKLLNYDKVLQSSLYMWGINTHKLALQYIEDLLFELDDDIAELEDQQVAFELQAIEAEKTEKWVKFGINALLIVAGVGATFGALACPIATVGVGAAIAAVDTGAVASFGLITVNFSLLVFDFFDNIDSSSAGDFYRSLIPENEIMEAKTFKQYLTDLKNNLTTVKQLDEQYPENRNVVNVRSYYDLDYDNEKSELVYKHVYEFDPNTFIYTEPLINAYPDETYMRGKFYMLKNLVDFHDAQKHIIHQYEERDITIENCSRLDPDEHRPDELNEGVPRWWYFTASETGTYCIDSGSNEERPNQDDIVCEIFDEPVNGRSTAGLVNSDSGTGNKGNFKMYYYLEAGERIFIRVRGKDWDKARLLYSIEIKRVQLDEFSNFNINGEYKENNISFYSGAICWKPIRFKEAGYKLIQCFTNDFEGSMSLYNYKGELETTTTNVNAGYAGNGFLSFFANKNEYMFLKVVSPINGQSQKDDVKLTFTNVARKYYKIDNLCRLENGDLTDGYPNTFELEIGQVALGIFIPDLTAHYQFDSSQNSTENGIAVNVVDTHTGEIINKFNTTENNKDATVAQLDAGHEYLIMISFLDFVDPVADIDLYVSYYVTDYYVLPETPNPIALGNRYYENRVSSRKGQYADYWYSFANDGYRLIQLFGEYDNINVELYDIRNNLLLSDDGSNQTSRTCFLSWNFKADEPYRIRILNKGNYSRTCKLTITPVASDFPTFNHMPAYRNNDVNSSVTGLLSNGVGYFTAPYTGSFRFRMYDQYDYYADTFLYVIDPSSNSYLEYDVDYNDDGDDASNGFLVKNLTQGKTYFIVLSMYDMSNLNDNRYLSVRIDYLGRVLGNANENGGYANSVTFDHSIFSATYKPHQTALVLFDITCTDSLKPSDLKFDIEFTSYGVSDPCTKTISEEGNRKKVVAYLYEDVIYRVRISRIGGTYSGESLKMFISYTTLENEKESIEITGTYSYSRYWHKVDTLFSTQMKEYTFTFDNAGPKVFQTFGNKDTILELYNSSGSLLKRNDNDGYGKNAFIWYDVQANRQYILKVGLKYADDGGDVNTTVTPILNGLGTLTSFDNFYKPTFSGSYFNENVYLDLNCSRVLVIKPPKEGNYRFSLSFRSDSSYRYVWLQLSDTYVATGYNSQDSSSGMKKFTTYLNPSHYYYAVCSAKYFKTQSGWATLEITKIS